MNRLSLILVLVMLTGGAFDAAAQQKYVYTTIAFPGSIITVPTGVNNAGVVVGYYCIAGDRCTGFSYQDGMYETIGGPQGQLSRVTAINNDGVMTGSYFVTAGRSVGFVRQGGAQFSLSQPGFNVTMTGVSSVGTAVGNEQEEGGSETRAVTFKDGAFSVVQTPKMAYLSGVNSTGSIVGSLVCGTGSCLAQAFTEDADGVHLIPDIKYPYSYGVGINDSGAAVGTVATQTKPGRCVIITTGHVTSCHYPGAFYSAAFAINQAGDVAGSQTGKNGPTEAFVRAHSGEFTNVTPLDADPESAAFAAAISDSGVVVGAYYPSSLPFGEQVGFLATPVAGEATSARGRKPAH